MVQVRPLKPALYGWQIFFIAISSVIGGGVFNHNGEALRIAGPGGMLVAMAIMGLVAVAVMEGVSELTQLFPAPNAIVQYVRAFVDKDLAWVVGIAYWYIYASIFATQNIAAANLVNYWSVSQNIRAGAFYVVAPVIIFWINYIGVWWYGLVESVGGLLKIILVLGVSITLFVLARNINGVDEYSSSGAINDGFHGDTNYTLNLWTAMCWIIPVMAYGFVGVETVTIAAYEARLPSETHPSRSRWSWLTFLEVPSRFIAYFAFALYMICTISETLTVHWIDPWLPIIYGGNAPDQNARVDADHPPAKSRSMVVIAMLHTNHKFLAGFFTACLVFSVLSAANTSLYVASRTLYGLARDVPESNNILARLARSLSLVVPRTHTPALALIISTLSFIWLPFISLRDTPVTNPGETTQPIASQVVFEIIAVSSSVSCMLVWATLCIAFIRYRKWIDKFKDDEHWPAKWKHRDDAYMAFTYFGWMQPIPAYLGLLGCVLVVVFASASWWDTPSSVSKVLSAFIAPLIFVLIFGALKLLNWLKVFNWERDRWVRLTNEAGTLETVLGELRRLRRDQGDESEMDAIFRQQNEMQYLQQNGENQGNNGIHPNLHPTYPKLFPNQPFENQQNQPWAHQEVRSSRESQEQQLRHVSGYETPPAQSTTYAQHQTNYNDAEQQDYEKQFQSNANRHQHPRRPLASSRTIDNEGFQSNMNSDIGTARPEHYRQDEVPHTVFENPHETFHTGHHYNDAYQADTHAVSSQGRKSSTSSFSASASYAEARPVQPSSAAESSHEHYRENDGSRPTIDTWQDHVTLVQGSGRAVASSSRWTSDQDGAGPSRSTVRIRRRSTSNSASLE